MYKYKNTDLNDLSSRLIDPTPISAARAGFYFVLFFLADYSLSDQIQKILHLWSALCKLLFVWFQIRIPAGDWFHWHSPPDKEAFSIFEYFSIFRGLGATLLCHRGHTYIKYNTTYTYIVYCILYNDIICLRSHTGNLSPSSQAGLVSPAKVKVAFSIFRVFFGISILWKLKIHTVKTAAMQPGFR